MRSSSRPLHDQHPGLHNALLAVAALIVASAAAPHRTAAQQVPNRAAAIEVRKQFLADMDTLEAKFLGLANAIPADKYAWRPAPGVRSVGEVFMHVASEFYVYNPLAYGAPRSPVISGHGEPAFKAFEAHSTKADVLKHLRDGFAYTKTTIGGLDADSLVGTKKLFGADRTIIENVLCHGRRSARASGSTHCVCPHERHRATVEQVTVARHRPAGPGACPRGSAASQRGCPLLS